MLATKRAAFMLPFEPLGWVGESRLSLLESVDWRTCGLWHGAAAAVRERKRALMHLTHTIIHLNQPLAEVTLVRMGLCAITFGASAADFLAKSPSMLGPFKLPSSSDPRRAGPLEE